MWDTMKLKKVHVIKVLREEREEQKKNMRAVLTHPEKLLAHFIYLCVQSRLGELPTVTLSI